MFSPGLNVEDNLKVANYGKSPDLLEEGLETVYKNSRFFKKEENKPLAYLVEDSNKCFH